MVAGVVVLVSDEVTVAAITSAAGLLAAGVAAWASIRANQHAKATRAEFTNGDKDAANPTTKDKIGQIVKAVDSLEGRIDLHHGHVAHMIAQTREELSSRDDELDTKLMGLAKSQAKAAREHRRLSDQVDRHLDWSNDLVARLLPDDDDLGKAKK